MIAAICNITRLKQKYTPLDEFNSSQKSFPIFIKVKSDKNQVKKKYI